MSDIDSAVSESRRLLLERLLGGTGAAALLGMGGMVSPAIALAQMCAPPGPPGSARAWRHDCRPIRPRRPASTLGSDDIQKLKNAYQAMRDLSVSDPNDPRGFVQQAHIHCWNCGQGVQVHGSWQFFAWHRAYLYFHERILGKLIGDSDFRLPYWDWDTASHRTLPGAYTNPNDATNPLWNGTRGMSPTDEVPDEDVGTAVMTGVMGLATFPEFGAWRCARRRRRRHGFVQYRRQRPGVLRASLQRRQDLVRLEQGFSNAHQSDRSRVSQSHVHVLR
jgi:hypothetical protein